MDIGLEKSWKKLLSEETEKAYFQDLVSFVNTEYSEHTVFPEQKNIFEAFEKCKFDDLKVVIIGQDPYHGPGQANGLSFSVNDGVKLPPSLKNIFKELNSDLGKMIPSSGNLNYWSEQGVLLLNATLTVRASSPGSHQKKGWEQFTDKVINIISDQKKNVVFLLWGNYAQSKSVLIDANKHCVLRSPHPSPFSAHKGFFGNKHFSKTNAYLKSNGLQEISW